MFARRATRRLTLWMALLAVLMMAFAPLVSQAVGAGQAWQEICGVNGSRWIQADANGNTQDPQDPDSSLPSGGAHLLDHCPYCSLHADTLGMPPAALAALPALPRVHTPPAFLQAPTTLHAWITAQPRGPPSVC